MTARTVWPLQRRLTSAYCSSFARVTSRQGGVGGGAGGGAITTDFGGGGEGFGAGGGVGRGTATLGFSCSGSALVVSAVVSELQTASEVMKVRLMSSTVRVAP